MYTFFETKLSKYNKNLTYIWEVCFDTRTHPIHIGFITIAKRLIQNRIYINEIDDNTMLFYILPCMHHVTLIYIEQKKSMNLEENIVFSSSKTLEHMMQMEDIIALVN